MIEEFLIDEIDDCTHFAVFLEFLMKEFLELLIEMRMKMKMIVSENSSLLMIRGIIVSLMLVEVIFLSEVIVLSLIDLEMMILDV